MAELQRLDGRRARREQNVEAVVEAGALLMDLVYHNYHRIDFRTVYYRDILSGQRVMGKQHCRETAQRCPGIDRFRDSSIRVDQVGDHAEGV